MTVSQQKISQRQFILISAGLALLIVIAFEPLRHNGFISYDDSLYIVENPHIQNGLTGSAVIWAFTARRSANWHPLTWLSHMVDIELFGLNPVGHHLHNLLLHILNTILLFWVLHKMTGALWRSAFVATVFGIHPLRVESIAWAAERKDVLCMFFIMLTLAAYLQYVKHGGIMRYLPVIICFILSLMAKPMAVTLPLILLLLDFWPLGRIYFFSLENKKEHHPTSLRWLIAEKIPLLTLTVASCITTYLVQQKGGSFTTEASLGLRLFNASFSYIAYIGKYIWPINLGVLYPFNWQIPSWWALPAILTLLITTAALIRCRKQPYLTIGWLWYMITLIPVIGIVHVGTQLMADRYTYLPLIGLSILTGWLVNYVTQSRPYRKIILGVSSGLLVIAMIITTRIQTSYWKDSITLYEHTLAVTRDNFIMHNNLGLCFLKQGRMEQAEEQFNQSLTIRSNDPEVYLSIAYIDIARKDLDNALRNLNRALEINAHHAPALFNIGVLMELQNHTEEALNYYEQAAQADPDHFKALSRAGTLYMRQDQWEKAIAYFRKSLAINPNYTEALRGLEECLGKSSASK